MCYVVSCGQLIHAVSCGQRGTLDVSYGTWCRVAEWHLKCYVVSCGQLIHAVSCGQRGTPDVSYGT